MGHYWQRTGAKGSRPRLAHTSPNAAVGRKDCLAQCRGIYRLRLCGPRATIGAARRKGRWESQSPRSLCSLARGGASGSQSDRRAGWAAFRSAGRDEAEGVCGGGRTSFTSVQNSVNVLRRALGRRRNRTPLCPRV